MRLTTAIVLLLASTLAAAQLPSTGSFDDFGPQPEFLPVEEAYRLAVQPQEDGNIRLYWQIEPGYYLYQHRFKFGFQDTDAALEPSYPKALEKTDEFFGEVKVYYDSADILLTPGGEVGRVLEVTSQGCADAGLCYPPHTERFQLNFAALEATATDDAAMAAQPPAGGSGPAAPNQAAQSAGASSLATLPYMLLLAFLGGIILNLMPCVFPILSLKVLSFTGSSDHDRHLHGWLYAAGVVSSFLAVAAVLISLQQAGQAIGWGFQLQSPGFVIALAYLFVAMGLSLSGLVDFGGSLANTGSGLAARGGLSGSYFTGVLAVVVASPCTAPFMGTALGFAMTQPAYVALTVFAALGAGMAAPLLALSYSSTLRRIMPAPGPWMDTLKQLLAFPLYASAIWLFWVAGRQTGVNTMALALCGALALALGLWLWRYQGWKRLAAVACVALAVSAAGWRGLDNAPGARYAATGGHVPWSEQELAQLRAAGQPVFVDVTADWCITCLANEQAVLFTDDMQRAFEAHGVTYMVADWTSYDADIADYLAGYGRNGIPFYAMYPADQSGDAIILPQLLTRDTVLKALAAVSGKKAQSTGDLAELGEF
ncbi:MAG: protein-disulfide reductase DsbD [Pseudomonadota bacterium]